MLTRYLGIALVIGTALGFGTRPAEAFQHGTHTWTSVSGYSGTYKKETLVTSNALAIYMIKGYEKADDPVYIEAQQNMMGTANTTTYGWLKLIVRYGWNLSSSKYASVGKDRYIVALRVCTTDENESSKRKIKGIRIWPGRINANGTVASDGAAEEWERTNCKKWRNKVSCPANTVVTGLRGYYKSEDKGFSGLSARCSTTNP